MIVTNLKKSGLCIYKLKNREFGYNIAFGGENNQSGKKRYEKTKFKMSISRLPLGKPAYIYMHFAETRQKISNSKKGKKMSESKKGGLYLIDGKIEIKISRLHFRDLLSR